MDDRYAVEVLKVLGEINDKLDVLFKAEATNSKEPDDDPKPEGPPNEEVKEGAVKIKRKIKK